MKNKRTRENVKEKENKEQNEVRSEGRKSRIFITGDTHCPHDVHKLKSDFFPQGKELTKDDILIICGDAGFVWDNSNEEKWWINWISEKPWTTIYCDGNHEGHVLLKTYPVTKFHGAKVHKITDSLYHVLRGEVMNLNGKKFFFFGGGFSHDIEYRTENISWWQEEMPVQSEIDNAIDNLNKVENKVDYIITHDVPAKINLMLGYNEQSMKAYDNKYVNLSSFLQNIYETVEFSNWFAGHYHIDKKVDKIQILYHLIGELNENGKFNYVDTPVYKVLNHKKFSLSDIEKVAKKHHLFINEFLQIGRPTLKGRTVIIFSEFLEKYKGTLSDDEIDLLGDNLKKFLLDDMRRNGCVTLPVSQLESTIRK